MKRKMIREMSLFASQRPPRTGRRHGPRPAALRFALLCILVALTAGCSGLFPPLLPETDATGSLTVAIRPAALPLHDDDVFQIKLSNEEQKFELTQEVPADGTESVVAFDRIAQGRWRIDIHLIEADQVVTYSGSDEVYVGDERAHIHVQLLPNPGELELHMDLGDGCVYVQGTAGCLSDEDRPARYVTEPPFQATNRGDFVWPAGASTHTVEAGNVPPGSYELHIAFYDDKRTGKPLFQSDWHGFDVFPGRRSRVVWHPEVGSVDVGVTVLGPPPPPENAAVVTTDGRSRLAWQPPGAPVDGYSIYAKGAVQPWFCKVGDVAGDVLSWPLPEGDVPCGEGNDRFTPAAYAVTAHNGMYESVRSNIVEVETEIE